MRRFGLGMWIALLAAAGTARAEEWNPPVPAGCPQRPADADAARQQAGEMFRSGTAQGEAGDPGRATDLYSCSYVLMPHPNTLYNLAVVAEQAGRLEVARGALERYLAEAPDALNRTEAETLLASVRERIAALPPPPVEPPPVEPPPVEPPPVEPPPVATPPDTPPPPTGLDDFQIAAIGLAGAGLLIGVAGGAAFGVLAADEQDLVENSPEDTPWIEVAPHQDDFELYSNLEIASFAVGGAALVTAALLLLLDPGPEAPPAQVAPVLTPDAAGLAVVGRF